MAKTQDIAALKSQIIRASLDLAAEKSWTDITMTQVAAQAHMDVADVMAIFADKTDILCAHGRAVDAQVAGALNGQSMADDASKDRLFDVLMERFDILNDNRAAMISILNSLTMDPKQMVISLPWLCRSMTAMLELADIPTSGWQGALRVAGLTGVYLKVLRDWIKDDSADMAATMASLDGALSRADQMAGYLKI